MRIALYNRWLHTLGGGERETGAFAQALQSEHQVDLLTHQPVDLELFRTRLNLPLRHVRVRTLPCDADLRSVAEASSEYDLFVNMSHGDMFVPRARHNLLRVFFPVLAAPASHDEGQKLTLLDGFYRPEPGDGSSFAWTSARSRAMVTMPSAGGRLFRRRSLRCVLHGWRPAGIPAVEVRLAVNGYHLGARRLPTDATWRAWEIVLPPEFATVDELEVTLEATTFWPRDAGLPDDCRELGVALRAIEPARRGWLGTRALGVGGTPDDAAYTVMLRRRTLPAARAYDLILANSRFTRDWIGRRWMLPSDVVYPPVEVESFQPGPKRPMVLNVGRFFAGSHNKKHLPMITAFRALCDTGLHGWELHLAGGCDEAMPEHRAYLAYLRTAAQGYPISFHVNASFDTLRALYRDTQIYWHATGFGEDQERSPEAFEHFGITTVEAMAAGCVPIVIAAGGQIEIVEPGSGFLWTTLEQLQAYTRALVEDAGLRERMSEEARRRSYAFGMDRFAADIRRVVGGYAQTTGGR